MASDAFEMMRSVLTSWGLLTGDPSADGALLNLLQGYATDQVSADGIRISLRQSDAYKRRFAGLIERQKKGFSAMSESDYLNQENAYKGLLIDAGFANSQWNNQSTFANWIAGDVSAAELERRITKAEMIVNSKDAATRTALKDYYGITDKDLVAYWLDPANGEVQLNRKAEAARLGALANGVKPGMLSRDQAEWAASQAEQQGGSVDSGVARSVMEQDSLGQLGGRFGESWSMQDSLQANVANDTTARVRKQRLLDSEKALFQGDSGVGRNSLSRKVDV